MYFEIPLLTHSSASLSYYHFHSGSNSVFFQVYFFLYNVGNFLKFFHSCNFLFLWDTRRLVKFGIVPIFFSVFFFFFIFNDMSVASCILAFVIRGSLKFCTLAFFLCYEAYQNFVLLEFFLLRCKIYP